MVKILYLKISNNIFIGWNSWNHFHCDIHEKLIQETADMLVATGLAALGYQYGLFFH